METKSSLLRIIAASILFVEGFFVLSRDFKKRLYQIFSAVCFLTGLWHIQVAVVMSGIVPVKAIYWMRIIESVLVFYAPVMFHLCLIVGRQVKKNISYLCISYGISVFMVILNLFGLYKVNFISVRGERFFKADIFFSLHVLTYAVFLSIGLYFLLMAFIKEKSTKQLMQIRYLLLASSIGTIAAALDVLPAYGAKTYPWGLYVHLIWPPIILYAIIKHHIFDIDVLLRKSLLYSLLTGILTGIHFIFAYFIGVYFYSQSPYRPQLITLVFIGMVVMVFTPLKEKVQKFIDKIFYREAYLYQNVVQQFSEEIGSIEDHKEAAHRLVLRGVELIESHREIADKLVSVINNTLHPVTTSIFLFDEKKKNFTLIASYGMVINLPVGTQGFLDGDICKMMIEEDGKLEVVWSGKDGSLTSKHIQQTSLTYIFQRESTQTRHLLSIPLIARGRLIGRLNLGPKLSEDKYYGDDLQLLSTLASHTAVAMRNVSEELERKKITQLFSRYVAPQIVNEIISSFERDGLQLGGKRRLVTVLFADIRGFTSMSERMEPEEVVGMLNMYLDKMTKVVFKHEGTLDKYIGDALMAVFNTPLEQVDHALKAVATACDMQKEIIRMNKELGYDDESTGLGYGIGINTGVAIAGNIGSSERMEYTVIGDAINLAARLEGIASKGKVIISSSTYQLVKDYVKVKKLHPISVKGKVEPVVVYEVTDCEC
jgi:class 3 adenylate cyclase